MNIDGFKDCLGQSRDCYEKKYKNLSIVVSRPKGFDKYAVEIIDPKGLDFSEIVIAENVDEDWVAELDRVLSAAWGD